MSVKVVFVMVMVLAVVVYMIAALLFVVWLNEHWSIAKLELSVMEIKPVVAPEDVEAS
jgi:hypothetical protein